MGETEIYYEILVLRWEREEAGSNVPLKISKFTVELIGTDYKIGKPEQFRKS